eukprot:scaffold84329_cov64-Phaeocystis_antarctica.AAC.3
MLNKCLKSHAVPWHALAGTTQSARHTPENVDVHARAPGHRVISGADSSGRARPRASPRLSARPAACRSWARPRRCSGHSAGPSACSSSRAAAGSSARVAAAGSGTSYPAAAAAARSLVVHLAVRVGAVGRVVRLLDGALARRAAPEAGQPFELVLLGVLHGRSRGGEGDAAGGGEGEAGAEEGAQVARGHGRGGEGRGGGGPDGGGREAGRHGGAAGREARGGDARGIVRHLAPRVPLERVQLGLLHGRARDCGEGEARGDGGGSAAAEGAERVGGETVGVEGPRYGGCREAEGRACGREGCRVRDSHRDRGHRGAGPVAPPGIELGLLIRGPRDGREGKAGRGGEGEARPKEPGQRAGGHDRGVEGRGRGRPDRGGREAGSHCEATRHVRR